MDFNKLWQNFLDTIQNHYVDFNGRVGRSQFWYFMLVLIGLDIAVEIVAGTLHLSGLSSLYGLAILLPSVGMVARRFHDIGKPTSWVFILAIPVALEFALGVLAMLSMFLQPLVLFFAGLAVLAVYLSLAALIVAIYFCAQPGVSGPNEFGPVPPVFAPN